jgi:hypothetical protein
VLRKDLPPLDTYLADAMQLAPAVYLERHPWPMLVIPEPDPAVIAMLQKPETVVHDDSTLMVEVDPTSNKASGASLDALCLPVQPKLNETISRLHAEISWDAKNDRAMLADLGGKNGIVVDTSKLPPHGRTALLPGAVISFGALITRFYSPRAFLSWLQTGAPRAGASPGVWPTRPRF